MKMSKDVFLIRVDLPGENNIPLPVGEISLGRGSILGCDDKRISRKHCLLRVSNDGIVTLVSLHTNPCFYKVQTLDSFVVLLKNQSKILHAGDEFALLPNSFQYRVVVPEAGNIQSDFLSEESYIKMDENMENKMLTAPEVEQATNQGQRIQNNIHDTERSILDSDSPTPSKRKRALPEWLKNLSDDEHNNSTIKASTPTTSAGVTGYKREVSSDETDLKKVKSEAEEELDVSCKFETDVDDYTNVRPIPDDSFHQLHGDKLGSDMNKDGCEPKHGGASTSAARETNLDTNQISVFGGAQPVPGDGDQINDVNKDGYEASYGDSSPAARAPNMDTNQSAPGTPSREPCIYAVNCYRKNPQHRTDFSHPGDADFLMNQDLPECPFGTSCYRKNILHRKDYKHTQPPSAPPPLQGSGDSSQTRTKRRTTAKNSGDQDDLSEDDYDYDDPFLNDGSSDDYEPTSSENSDLEEEEDEDEESQERRRMLKEAKKFTRRKNKNALNKKNS